MIPKLQLPALVVPWLSRLLSWREELRSLCVHQGEWLTCWGPTAVSSHPEPAHYPSPHSSEADRMQCVWMASVTIPCMMCKMRAFVNQVQFHWLNCRHYLTTFGLSHICTRQWCVSWRSGRVQVGGPGVSEVPPTRRKSGPRWCALWLFLLKFAVLYLYWYFWVSLNCSVRWFFLFTYFTHRIFSKCTDIWYDF